MKLEKGRISAIELTLGVCCFMQGTMLRSVFIISISSKDSWIIAFTGLLFFLPCLVIYATLVKWFPGRSLFEINEEVFGPVAGKICSLAYVFFFLSLAALNTMDAGNFVLDFLIPETPAPAILIFFMCFCIYTVRKGIEGIMRMGTLFPFIAFVSVLFNFMLVLGDVQWNFLLPMFRLPAMKYVQATHVVGTIPYGECLAFLAVAPSMSKGAKIGKHMFFGLLVSAIFMALVIVRDIVTLGPLVDFMSLPSFEAVRTVNYANIITRTESIYGLLMMCLMHFKITVLLYVSVLGIAQLAKLNSYRHLACVVGALVVCYSMLVFRSSMENAFWGSNVAPIFSSFFEYLMPAFTLLAAYLRKLHRKAEAAAV